MTLGIYLSRCLGAVDDVIDVETALDDVRQSASVIRVFDDFVEPAVMEQILEDVAVAGIDSVVLAGRSEEYYAKSLSGGHLLQRLSGAGVNPNRIAIANILDQVALAHPDDPDGATVKARALIGVAALRAQMAYDAEGVRIKTRHSVLVLGVTSEAIVAAERLLRLGFPVILADRGRHRAVAEYASGLQATAGFVLGHAECRMLHGARLIDGDGWLGDFRITLESVDGQSTHNVGGILLARPDDADWIAELRNHFRVDIDADGNARALSAEVHPAETIDPGIMVVPVRGDKQPERDRITAAESAVMAFLLRLSRPVSMHFSDVSEVDEALCGGCATCVRTCAFGACSIGPDGVSKVDERRCRGCGKCVVSCPVGARDVISSPHGYLLSAVRQLAEAPVEGERVLGFLCGGCGYPAADRGAAFVAERGEGYPSSFLPLRIPCGGRLDTLYVLEAFKAGFDAVCVYRCREGHCHNLIGNLDMDRRINLLRTVLRSRNIDDARLRIVDISPDEGARFVDSVESVFDALCDVPVMGGVL